MWCLVSDVDGTIYSHVTNAITIHQVVLSKQLVHAYILFVILLVPFASMFILVVHVSVKMGTSLTHGVAALLIGLLLLYYLSV